MGRRDPDAGRHHRWHPRIPALTPDGKYVAFLVRGAVALLDPATVRVVGVKKIGDPPDGPVLAFSPDGKTLSVGGTGRTVLLDLASGEVWDAIVAEMRTSSLGALPDFGWAGDHHFYSDGHLYDPDTPIPLWNYHGAVWARPCGREVWTVAAPLVTPGKEKVITLRAYTLPHPGVQAKIDAKLARPGVFALRPGDAVTIDVSALPADRRAEAWAALHRQAKAVGYRPALGASVALVATTDATGPKQSTTYNNWLTGSSERIEYVERHARLKVVRAGDGRVRHRAEASLPAPFSIHLKPGEKVADHAGHAGEPDYRLYDRKLPAVVRGPAAVAGALGWGTFTATGVEDRKTRLDDLR